MEKIERFGLVQVECKFSRNVAFILIFQDDFQFFTHHHQFYSRFGV